MEPHDYSDVNNYLKFNVASQNNFFLKSLRYQIKIDPSELISNHSAKAEGKRKIADRGASKCGETMMTLANTHN